MILDNSIVRQILSKSINVKCLLNEKALFKNLLILSYLSSTYKLKLNI